MVSGLALCCALWLPALRPQGDLRGISGASGTAQRTRDLRRGVPADLLVAVREGDVAGMRRLLSFKVFF